VNKYWLEQYWDKIQLLCYNPTQILLPKFLKKTMNRFCTETMKLTNIHHSENIQPKLVDKCFLESSWHKIQLLFYLSSQIWQVGSPKIEHRLELHEMTRQIWHQDLTGQRLQRVLTQVPLNETMHMSTLSKGIKKIYNFHTEFISWFDF
jgi:hypothetical protein